MNEGVQEYFSNINLTQLARTNRMDLLQLGTIINNSLVSRLFDLDFIHKFIQTVKQEVTSIGSGNEEI